MVHECKGGLSRGLSKGGRGKRESTWCLRRVGVRYMYIYEDNLVKAIKHCWKKGGGVREFS
jgi:hypothetical protein